MPHVLENEEPTTVRVYENTSNINLHTRTLNFIYLLTIVVFDI